MMHKVLVLNNISPLGLKKFSKENYTISANENDPDAILVRSAKMHEIEIGKSLKAFNTIAYYIVSWRCHANIARC